MKALGYHRVGWAVMLVAVVLLAACGPGGTSSAPSPTAMERLAAVLPTRIPPTEGPSPTPLPSATPTATPTRTPTATPRPSAATEPLTVVLTWATADNLDLGVLEPTGTFISHALAQSPDGAVLSADANADCDAAITEPFEQVTWPVGAAQDGSYTVLVRYQTACGDEESLDATITVRLGDQTTLLEESATLEVDQQYELTFAFDGFETSVLAAAVERNSAAPQAIRYGDEANGVITPTGFEALYTFEGQQGDVITATMRRTSDDLDTYLTLLDAEGEAIASNDNAGFEDVSTDSLLDQVSLPSDGMYTLVATRLDGPAGLTAGAFTLALNLLVDGAAASQSTGTLAYDETARGLIADDQNAVSYTFSGSANDVIVIDMVRLSGNLDPHLTLLGPDGDTIGTNDDTPSAETLTDARLDHFLLPETGAYTVLAGRSPATASTGGVFEVALTIVSNDPADAVLFAPQALAYGDTAAGAIDDLRFERIYTFEGSRGDPVTIELSRVAGDLDAYLILLDAAGNQLAYNDDAAGMAVSTDSRIANFRLPSDGTYTIVATRFRGAEGDSSGAFELHLASIESIATRQITVTLEVANTGSVSESGSVFRQMFPGDDARNNSYHSFLSFTLPPEVTANTLMTASLLLGDCTLNGAPFDDLGALTVQVESYGTLETTDFDQPDSAVRVGVADSCPAAPLEITQAVQSALQNGERTIQFRLSFPVGSDDDGAIDDVTFTAPELVLEVRAP